MDCAADADGDGSEEEIVLTRPVSEEQALETAVEAERETDRMVASLNEEVAALENELFPDRGAVYGAFNYSQRVINHKCKICIDPSVYHRCINCKQAVT